MPVGDRSHGLSSLVTGGRIVMGALALGFAAGLVLLSGAGCMTRSEKPVWAPDSTLVYPSKKTNDINATISFQLKDSAAREAIKKADKERRREITKLKRKRDDILALEEERQRKAQADAKRKAEAQKKSKGKKKKKKTDEDVAVAPLPVLRIDPALRDSLDVIQKRLTTLEAEDSLSATLPWKLKREDGSAVGEHSFEIEEGASVRATIRLENVYARGKRPIMFHFVWLNPEKKRVFKRMVEYMPNDSTQTLSSTLSLTPTKRSAGHYSLQVFLFREQIAEKWFELTGKGKEEDEKGDEGM
jgi:hypothetical protein